MPDRTTKVTLTADTAGYVAGMDKAANATKKMADDGSKKLAEHHAAMTQVGTASLAMGAALAAGVALAVSKFAEFDKAMSGVQAATHESAQNMGSLREAAIKAGADTVFSATEAANAVEELSKAGLSTSDVLSGALAGSLDLASAGELGVADAAGIMATSLAQFKQPGSEAGHVADLLAAGAGKAMGEVSDLSAALNQGGLVAAQAGKSIEETTGTLAAFAHAGLVGSDAGTSLKTMLLALEKPSTIAAKTMKQYGIDVYDTNGNMLSMSAMAGQLQERLGHLSDEQRNSALATIFGTDAVRSASVLYSEGADGIQSWIDKTNDAGYAAETARLKLDNLSGDLEQLGGSIDTDLIQTGSGANEVLRALTQDLTGFINAVGQVPAPVLGVGLGLTALTAATALAGGAFFLAVPKLAAFRVALETMGPAAQRTGAALGAVGKAAGIVAVVAAAVEGLSLLAHTMDAASASAEDLQNALKVGGTGAKTFAAAFKGLDAFTISHHKDNWGKFIDVISRSPDNRWLPGFTHDLFALSPATDAARDKLAALGKEMSTLDPDQAGTAFQGLVDQMGGSKKAASELLDLMPDYRDALVAQATALNIDVTSGSKAEIQTKLLKLAQEGATDTTKVNTAAIQEQQAATEEATEAQQEWAKMVSDSDSSFVDLKGSIKDVSVSLDKYLKDLQKQVDAQTSWEKNMILLSGRASQGLLDELARMGPEGAPLVAKLVTASDKELAKMETLYAQRAGDATMAFTDTLANSEDVIKAASAQLGKKAANEIATKLANGTATVQQIIDQYGLIIESKKPEVKIRTDEAEAALNRFMHRWNGATVNLTAAVTGKLGSGILTGPPRANGGILPGAPSRTDNMVIQAASGEYLTRAQQAAIPENRRALDYMNAGGVIPGYATGGMVGFQPAPVYTPAPQRMYSPGPGASGSGVVELGPKSLGVMRQIVNREVVAVLASSPSEMSRYVAAGNKQNSFSGGN